MNHVSTTAAPTQTPTTPSSSLLQPAPTIHCLQVRHATFVLRHRRPYQFTQLVQLSDGSTFTHRTTSPVPLHRSTKDSRNHLLWQPSETSLRNVEVDEAGKLAAFRARFGRGWDTVAGPEDVAATTTTTTPAPGAEAEAAADGVGEEEGPGDAGISLSDLISGYAAKDDASGGGLSAKEQAKADRSGKKRK